MSYEEKGTWVYLVTSAGAYAVYLVIIVAGLTLTRVLLSPPFEFDALFRSSLVFAVVTSVGFNLVFEMGGLLGFGTLKNLLIGRYVQPKREQRVFLLMDMTDSTGLAERLGPVLFHQLLNDFFRDIANAAPVEISRRRMMDGVLVLPAAVRQPDEQAGHDADRVVRAA